MKKKNGFTLIELLIAMLILLLVLGAAYSVLRQTVFHHQAGMDRGALYYSGRAVMDDIKVTLKHADPVSIKFYDLAADEVSISTGDEGDATYQNISSMKYDSVMVTDHYAANPENKTLEITIELLEDRKQLKVTTKDGNVRKSKVFPESTDGKNVDFTYFPVRLKKQTIAEGTDITYYEINIPFKYKMGNSDKTENLLTHVNPMPMD